MSPGSSVTRREIDEIAALGDPVLRNLRITQTYHELGLGMARLLGPGNVSWCAFATWASKTAGVTIRGEALGRSLRAQLDKSPHIDAALERANELGGLLLHMGVARRLEHTHVARVFDEVLARVSARVAEGNLAVFRELAPVFAGLLEVYAAHAQPSPEPLLRFLDTQLPDAQQQGHLRDAFSEYIAAISDGDPARKAQRVLLANLQAVLHEQIRLQEVIADSLDAPVREVLGRRLQRRALHLVPFGPLRRLIRRQSEELVRELGDAWERAASEHLLVLATADERFALCSDVPPLAGRLFSAPLARLDHADLLGFVACWDRSAGQGSGSGAQDWQALEDRMCFLLNLFRSRQQHAALLAAPFSELQRAALARGQLPSGPL